MGRATSVALGEKGGLVVRVLGCRMGGLPSSKPRSEPVALAMSKIDNL